MSYAQVYREALEAAAKCCEDRMSTYSRGSEVRRAMCEQMAKEIRSLPLPDPPKVEENAALEAQRLSEPSEELINTLRGYTGETATTIRNVLFHYRRLAGVGKEMTHNPEDKLKKARERTNRYQYLGGPAALPSLLSTERSITDSLLAAAEKVVEAARKVQDHAEWCCDTKCNCGLSDLRAALSELDALKGGA